MQGDEMHIMAALDLRLIQVILIIITAAILFAALSFLLKNRITLVVTPGFLLFARTKAKTKTKSREKGTLDSALIVIVLAVVTIAVVLMFMTDFGKNLPGVLSFAALFLKDLIPFA